jgi:hypothetical protein
MYGKAIATLVLAAGALISYALSPSGYVVGIERSLVVGGALVLLILVLWMPMPRMRFVVGLMAVICISAGLA